MKKTRKKYRFYEPFDDGFTILIVYVCLANNDISSADITKNLKRETLIFLSQNDIKFIKSI